MTGEKWVTSRWLRPSPYEVYGKMLLKNFIFTPNTCFPKAVQVLYFFNPTDDFWHKSKVKTDDAWIWQDTNPCTPDRPFIWKMKRKTVTECQTLRSLMVSFLFCNVHDTQKRQLSFKVPPPLAAESHLLQVSCVSLHWRRITDRPEDRLWQTTVSCHRRRVASKWPRADEWHPPPFRDEPRCLEGALAECEIHVAPPQRRVWRRMLFCCLRRQSERILTASCWRREEKKRREEEGGSQLSSAW